MKTKTLCLICAAVCFVSASAAWFNAFRAVERRKDVEWMFHKVMEHDGDWHHASHLGHAIQRYFLNPNDAEALDAIHHYRVWEEEKH
jgi:hypothetical protein